MHDAPVGVRWTIGDVSDRGWEELRLSVWGARRVFGPDAALAVCVNTIPVEAARRRLGELPEGVRFYQSSPALPEFLKPHVDASMAEGVAWKFSPLQVFPDRYELALDNDCILWEMPAAIRRWLAEGDTRRCVTAEDVTPALGQFEQFCSGAARNGGIRGLPPGFDLEGALRRMLAENPVRLTSELDEQGLQIAVLERFGDPLVVTLEEVTICSPFWPHRPHLGRCGAHFVGSNARHITWDYYDRPADEWMAEHWAQNRDCVYERVGLHLDQAPSTHHPTDETNETDEHADQEHLRV